MPIVTFLSDFGLQDHYVAAVKAKILSESPDVQIIDISHNIKKYDLIHTAHVLRSVYKDFPEGTIHLVSVNTSNQKAEEMIACTLNDHHFIGSNNGLFSLIEEKDPQTIVELATDNEGDVFPAKNILAEAAAKMHQKQDLSALGEPFDITKYQKFTPLRIKATREMIQGHVIHIDSYGNLITNIPKTDYDILSKDKNILIKFRNYGLNKVLQTYHETKGGEAFALFNSNGFLEIGIQQGNAAELLGMEYSSMVTIKFSDY